MKLKTKTLLFTLLMISFLAITAFVIQKNIFLLNFDTSIAAYVSTLHSPFLDTFMVNITTLGDVYQVIFLFIICAIVFIAERKKYMLYELILGLGLAGLLPEIIKILVQRARPISHLLLETDYSFPSAHATVAAALWCITTFLIAPLIKNRLIQKIFIILSSILFPLIALSRIYLSVHWASDVLAGILLGSACYLFANIVVLRYEENHK